jgi:hypothetical protein
MHELTRKLWDRQNQHAGDRQRLFAAVGRATDATTALYPGSYVDIAASFTFPSVTYVDSDGRAARFFSDSTGVDEIIAEHGPSAQERTWEFIGADYTTDVGLPDAHFDLLISLYAGFVAEPCARYLRPRGWLLVNPSHGDAAIAAIDPRYRLVGVLQLRAGAYSVSDRNLDSYLIPKRDVEVTADLIHESGRGVAYTKSPFAYLFRLVCG